MTDKPAASLSDLPTRFAAGVAMIAVAVAAVYFGGWPFRLLVLAATVLMLLEWNGMHRVARIWSYAGAVLLAAMLLGVTEWLFPADEMDESLVAASFGPAFIGYAAIIGLGLLLGLASRRVVTGWGFVYLAIPAFSLLVINWAWFAIAFWVLVVTWATDIFAYFAGRAIGGPKLSPRISPNKTWAGLFGGMAGAAVLGAIVAWWFGLGAPFTWLGALMGALAQAGDLYESWLKRRAGVKDSGNILPGHGGVLDRLDGLLPVTVATLLLLAAGLWVE